MSSVPCFLVTPNGRERRWLRRFVFSTADGSTCPTGYGYHNARSLLGDGDTLKDADGHILPVPDAECPPRTDPRWPTHCACGYAFRSADEWQVSTDEIYAAEDGRTWPRRELPPGAMYDAWWMPNRWKGADGKSLTVVLPDGVEWTMDAPAKDGKPWSRTGTPPNVTANPSILTPNYHGWLRDGRLVAC